jgi:hypothetical protein
MHTSKFIVNGKVIALSLIMISCMTSCYRMPRDGEYSVIPNTNNPDLQRNEESIVPNINH